jgi:hypothetical protein
MMKLGRSNEAGLRRKVRLLALLCATAIGLSGCVVYPSSYGYGYGAPAYYAPPVVVGVGGGWGWGRGWR